MPVWLICCAALLLWVLCKVRSRRAATLEMHREIRSLQHRTRLSQAAAAEIRRLALDGRTLEAAQRYREATGLSTDEARRYIGTILQAETPHRYNP